MLAGILISILSVWGLLTSLARRERDGILPALLVVVLAAGAAVLALSESLKFAQVAGVLASALMPLVLYQGRAGEQALLPGAVPAIAIVLPGLMLEGYFYTCSSVPLASFVLIIAAPLGMAIGSIPAFERMSRWRRTILQAAATAIPLGASLILAAMA